MDSLLREPDCYGDDVCIMMLSSLSGYALRTTAAQYKVHENPRFLHNSPGGAAGNASEQDPAVGLHSLTVQALGSGQRSESRSSTEDGA